MSKSFKDDKLDLENLPDDLMRKFIQNICEMSQDKISCSGDQELSMQRKMKMINSLRTQKVALETKEANEQHYEVPTEFFKIVLGPRLKYSCCLWDEKTTTFQKAEDDMLQLCCDRAQLKDGMELLDLGCGWGSITLYVLEKYPNCKVTCVSNSKTQNEYIRKQAEAKGFKNLDAIVADANFFDTKKRFDRIISVEMFEHMKNYQILMSRVASWLKNDGLLFVHILCHANYPYNFGSKDSNSWMAKYFFASGTMPSSDLLLYFQDDLKILDMWNINGKHYEKTLNKWLENLDNNKQKVLDSLRPTYGKDTEIMMKRWRGFFIYCAETWGYQEGKQWICTHLLFQKRNKSNL